MCHAGLPGDLGGRLWACCEVNAALGIRQPDRAASSAAPGRPGTAPLRVAVLVDLERRPDSGGHVKFWERIAAAAAAAAVPGLRLDLHFQGRTAAEYQTAPGVRLYEHRALFSTRRLPMLADMPDHADLAPLQPRLLRHLLRVQVAHCTDGYFAFAGTARLLRRYRRLALVTSVHTQTPAYGAIYADALLRRSSGDAAWAHWLLARLRPGARVEASLRRRLRRHLRRCDWLLAGTEVELASAELPAAAGRSQLRRGLDRRVFRRDASAAAAFAAACGLPATAIVLAHTGRLSHGKRVLEVADLGRALLERGHDVHVVFAGIGPLADAITARLGRRAHLLGHVDEATVAAMLSRAQMFVFPSRVEHWPNAVGEAMACAVPVLVAMDGGGRLLAQPGRDGLVPGTWPGDWLRAAESLIAEPARAAALGAAGARRARAVMPDWAQVLTEDLLPVWRRVACSARPSSS